MKPPGRVRSRFRGRRPGRPRRNPTSRASNSIKSPHRILIASTSSFNADPSGLKAANPGLLELAAAEPSGALPFPSRRGSHLPIAFSTLQTDSKSGIDDAQSGFGSDPRSAPVRPPTVPHARMQTTPSFPSESDLRRASTDLVASKRRTCPSSSTSRPQNGQKRIRI